ncbi:MAG: amidohydrolase family protein [Dehalococcoidia bacterium]
MKDRVTSANVIDADGHILEPRDLWAKGVPARFRGETIEVVWDESSQRDVTMLGGRMVQRASVNNGMARQPASRRANPRGWRWEELPPAGLEPKARVEELDREGIDAAVLYPSLGLVIGGIRDPEHAVAACRVYNEWLAEFCGAAPDRLVGMGAIPMQRPEAAPAEARRAVETLGMRGVFVRPNPCNGYFLNHRAYDPLWETLEGLGVPVGLHPSGTTEALSAAQTYKPLWGEEFVYVGKPMHFLIDDLMALTMMIGTGVLERFPRLKVVVLEAGGGWLPHWVDKMDHWFRVVNYQMKHLSMKPGEYVQRQVWTSFDPDETTLRGVIDSVGPDRLIWASDYPHMDIISPSVTEELYQNLKGLEDTARVKVLGANAREVYGL